MILNADVSIINHLLFAKEMSSGKSYTKGVKLYSRDVMKIYDIDLLLLD